MNDKDWERIKNLLIFRVYATDEEMDEMLPFFGWVGAIILVGFILLLFFGVI